MSLEKIRRLKSRASSIVRRELDIKLSKIGSKAFVEDFPIGIGIHPTAEGDYALAVRVERKKDIPEHLVSKLREEAKKSKAKFDYRAVEEINFLSNREPIRPLTPGLSIGQSIDSEGSGTLGMFVCFKEDSKLLILSCAHVLAYPRPILNQSIVQPGCPYGGKRNTDSCIARLSAFRSPFNEGINTVDAAVAVLKNQNQSLDTHHIPEIGRIVGITSEIHKPMKVSKFGSESHLTSGTVSAFELEISISVPDRGERIYFENQIEIQPLDSQLFSIPGDSGSVVVNDDNKEVVGLLFAGSKTGYSYANPIDLVFRELNLQLPKQP